MLAEAFGKAPEADGSRRIAVLLPAKSGASGYAVDLPSSYLTGSDAKRFIEIVTPLGTFLLPGHMLANNEDAKSADRVTLTFSITKAKTGAPGAAKFALVLLASTGGRELTFDHSGAFVEVRVPYEATAEERGHSEGLNVWHIGKDGKLSLVPSGYYDAAAREMVFKTDHYSTYAVSYFVRAFADMFKTPWAAEAVEALASKGIINGVSAQSFHPGASITRADFAKLIVAAFGFKAPISSAGSFADVGEDDYYHEAVVIAAGLGIVRGKGDGKFYPEENVTRQDMFVMMARALERAGKKLPQSATAEYADASAIAGYAREAAAFLTEQGLLQGGGDGMLHPANESTRAEAAVLLYRLFNYVFR